MAGSFFAALVVVFGLLSADLTSADFAEPILPADYVSVIGPGFATNWFKAVGLKKYREDNCKDVFNAGFTNVRLRSRADLPDFLPLNGPIFNSFLTNLSRVVDDCLKHNVAPIISWIHHDDEAYATTEARTNYLGWWEAVANQLKDKDYRLGFNLFTELGIDECGTGKKYPNCDLAIKKNPDIYNDWTSAVVKTIRATGGNNANRILLLAAPTKTSKALDLIDENIYKDDGFIMVEWHLYAAGPTHMNGTQKCWFGDGEEEGKANVDKAVKLATTYTANTGLLTYFGAWMAQTNGPNGLTLSEIFNFANYFIQTLGNAGIPWSLNVLDVYYETATMRWRTEMQEIRDRTLNMSLVLDVIKDAMSVYY